MNEQFTQEPLHSWLDKTLYTSSYIREWGSTLYIERLHVTSPRTARMVLHGKSSMAAVGDLLDYYYTLQDSDSRKRYKQKLSLFEGM